MNINAIYQLWCNVLKTDQKKDQYSNVTLVDGSRQDVPDVLNRIQVWGKGQSIASMPCRNC